MTASTTARELFQAAYNSCYTWDENFPGYSADVKLVQGNEVHTGTIRVNRNLSVEVTGIADELVREGINTQLQDVVTHRKRSNFEETHGMCDFTLGKTDETGAIEIMVNGNSTDSNYKIRGKEIWQVSRAVGRMVLLIDTHESFDTGSGYIASRYDAVFRNSRTNEVTSILKFEDSYDKFGIYYIMTKQIVQESQQGDRSTTEFSYSNIKLLKPAAV